MRLDTLRAELQKLRQKEEKLQEQMKKATSVYTTLPKKVGLKNMDELIKELLPLASLNLRHRLNGSAPGKKVVVKTAKAAPAKKVSRPVPAKTAAKSVRGKQPAYSDQLKAAVRQDMAEGKLTTPEISKKHNVGTDTLKKWKRKWGLTAGTKGQAKK